MEKDHQNLSREGLNLIGRKYAISLLGSKLKRFMRKLIQKILQYKQKNEQDGAKSFFAKECLLFVSGDVCLK